MDRKELLDAALAIWNARVEWPEYEATDAVNSARDLLRAVDAACPEPTSKNMETPGWADDLGEFGWYAPAGKTLADLAMHFPEVKALVEAAEAVAKHTRTEQSGMFHYVHTLSMSGLNVALHPFRDAGESDA